MKKSSSARNEPLQRIVLTFSRREELKYTSHLDIMRLWHRALRRAGMPLAYSLGFNPQPRIAIAAPLAVGVTSEAELMDVFLQRKVSLDFFTKTVNQQLPYGIEIMAIKEIWFRLPSLQSQLRFAEYRAKLGVQRPREEIAKSIESLLTKESLPWEHWRGEKRHQYDLRKLIDDIWFEYDDGSGQIVGMRLYNDSQGAGRPEQVILALGFDEMPTSIHRTRLIMSNN